MSEILSLKNKLDNHFDVLLDSVKNCSNDEPDILIITEEGNKIFTQRLLLYLYSPMMAGVLADLSSSVASAISLPVSSRSLLNLLNVLTSGVAVSEDTRDLVDIGSAAKIIGIDCDNFQIGVKKKKGISEKIDTKQEEEAKSESVQKVGENFKFTKVSGTSENIEKDPVSIEEDQEQDDVINSQVDTNAAVNLDSKTCECGKQFSTKEKLSRHALIHSGIKPFACHHCAKAFNRKDKLNEHIRNKHA